MILFLNIVTTLCIGLLIGTEFAVSAFINPTLSKLDNHSQAEATRLFGKQLGFVMPFWYGASLLLLILVSIFDHLGTGKALVFTASTIWAAAILQSVLVLVPINDRLIKTEAGEFSPKARQEHDKWDRLHRVRVAALSLSMTCFLVAIYR